MNNLINNSRTKKVMFKFSEELLSNQKHLKCLNYQSVNSLHCATVNLNQTNYYDILRVSKNADQKEIKRSYLELCKLFHPDIKESNLTEEDKIKKFQKINEAYSCLSKPESKLAYDQSMFQQKNPYYGYPYQSQYQNVHYVRRYPKRPDGYRPYDENTYKDSFKNKSSYSSDPNDPFKEFKNRSHDYGYYRNHDFDREFRQFREELRGSRVASREEIRLIKLAFYSFFIIAVYIFAVRIYVLKTHLKNRINENPSKLNEERFRTMYEDDPIYRASRYEERTK